MTCLGLGTKSDLQPPVQDGRGEGEKSAEAGVRLVQSQAEAAEVLQPVERVLDEVPGMIQALVIPVLHEAVALGRDADADAASKPMLTRLVAVVAFVAHHREAAAPPSAPRLSCSRPVGPARSVAGG